MFAAAVCAKRFLRGSLPWRDEGPRITAGCLRRQREQLEFLERQIEELDIRMQDPIRSDQPAVDLCVAIAGIEKVAAANWIAENRSTPVKYFEPKALAQRHAVQHGLDGGARPSPS